MQEKYIDSVFYGSKDSVFDGEYFSQVGPTENIDINKEVIFKPNFDYGDYFAKLILSILLVIGTGFISFGILIGVLRLPSPTFTWLLCLMLGIALSFNFINYLRWFISCFGFNIFYDMPTLKINQKGFEFNIFKDIPTLKINQKGFEFIYNKSRDVFEWEGVKNITFITVKSFVRGVLVSTGKYRILIRYSKKDNLGKEIPFLETEYEYPYFFYNDFSPYDFVKYLYDWQKAVLQPEE